MRRDIWTFTAAPHGTPLKLARWGHYGTPVLLYPSAGADCLEVERLGLIDSLAALIEAGRLKIYSPDGAAARAWLTRAGGVRERAGAQQAYLARVQAELVPQIRRDCESPAIEIVAAGAALGAASALASLLTDPQAFRAALTLSGVFERLGCVRGPLERHARPQAELPGVAALLAASPPRVRQRRVLLVAGRGDYEQPGETERTAALLGAQGVSSRVELWGTDSPHGFGSWRRMLPRYLAELL